MGLLDKVLKGIAEEIKSDIKTGIMNALDIEPAGQQQSSAPQAAADTPPAPAGSNYGTNSSYKLYPNNHPTGDDYFAAIITEADFPGYTIERAVSPRTLDPSAHPSCLPVSYLFRRDGQPVLAVLVMNSNQIRAMIARGTYDVLESNGIGYIRFFRGMENQRSYVLDRIKGNLR